jgi:hypothetical protein
MRTMIGSRRGIDARARFVLEFLQRLADRSCVAAAAILRGGLHARCRRSRARPARGARVRLGGKAISRRVANDTAAVLLEIEARFPVRRP